mmetsp:Transcript_39849/g.79709  ORF Transcript_39849/g.79709 Transcript_39849/m.79709 type:complete len:116 (-) Transcript_39849:461-808(-)
MLRESGTFCGLLDLLDERRLAPGEAATLAGLLLDGGEQPLPDWQHEPSDFASALKERAANAGTAYDATKRRMVPIVDAAALQKAMRCTATGIKIPHFVVAILVLVIAMWVIISSE